MFRESVAFESQQSATHHSFRLHCTILSYYLYDKHSKPLTTHTHSHSRTYFQQASIMPTMLSRRASSILAPGSHYTQYSMHVSTDSPTHHALFCTNTNQSPLFLSLPLWPLQLTMQWAQDFWRFPMHFTTGKTRPPHVQRRKEVLLLGSCRILSGWVGLTCLLLIFHDIV